MKSFFGEVVTAMVTPMNACANDEPSVDFDSSAKLAKYLIDSGSDALVLSGTTGEAPVTHIEEKEQLIRVVRKTFDEAFPGRDIPIIAGTGSNDTGHAIRNTESATRAGANAVLVVTPYYSRPSQSGLVAHFSAVARSTDLPVILYDVPGRSGVTIEPETYLELAKIPNIVSIKDATGNVYRGGKILSLCNQVRSANSLDKMTLYSGDDSLLLPFLSLGAGGIISVATHLVSKQVKQVFNAWKAGETDMALRIFNDITWAVDLLNGDGQQAMYTKTALNLLGLIPEHTMRLPNTGPSAEILAQIQQVIKRSS